MLLARMIKEGRLTISPSVKKREELSNILQRTDLCLDGDGWVAEGNKKQITIRPGYGHHQLRSMPNFYQAREENIGEQEFRDYNGVGLDELVAVVRDKKSVRKVDDTAPGVEEKYTILLHPAGRAKNPNLYILSYYKPE